MISAKRIGLAFSIVSAVLFGCAPQESEDVGGAAGASSEKKDCAAAVDISFVEVHESVPAKNVDPNLPEFKTCDTDLQILQVSGTKFDTEVNKILGSDLIGKKPACEDPESNQGSVILKYLANGVITTAGPSSWYAAGAAHPGNAIEYKNVDLQTGKEIALSDLVTEQARDTIVRSLKASIGAQKIPVFTDSGEQARDANGKPMFAGKDSTEKSILREAVDSSFGRVPNLGEFRDFAIGKTGIRIDLSNYLPHAMQGLEAQYLVKYSTLEGKLKTAGPITRLVPKK